MAGLVPGGPEANPKSGFPIVLSSLACGPRGCRLVPRHHIHARGRTRVEHEPPALRGRGRGSRRRAPLGLLGQNSIPGHSSRRGWENEGLRPSISVWMWTRE